MSKDTIHPDTPLHPDTRLIGRPFKHTTTSEWERRLKNIKGPTIRANAASITRFSAFGSLPYGSELIPGGLKEGTANHALHMLAGYNPDEHKEEVAAALVILGYSPARAAARLGLGRKKRKPIHKKEVRRGMEWIT